MSDAVSPLPWQAHLGPVFDDRYDGPRVPLDLMLQRLRRRFPDLSADVAAGDAAIRAHYTRLKAMGCPDVILGPWERRLGTEPMVTLDMPNSELTFQLAAIENPHLEGLWLSIDDLTPCDGRPDLRGFVAAAEMVAEALDFRLGLQVNSSAENWGIGIDADWQVADPHADLRAGMGAQRNPATGDWVKEPSELPDRGAAHWPAACRRTAAAWCDHAESRDKPAMLAAYGGAEGVAAAIQRDLAQLGPLTAFREHVTGAAFENTAVLTHGEWTCTIRFSGAPTGQLREEAA
ncbi:hypothetical protein [Alienimonas californiensis]|uniref:Uncharacterized protein n=1 Tax=Alienimonas californiensis TaxID=2527989 RepID=A0A517PBW1_9PLAN|nr:hypothetical protein [Alienimonas californiensis]QDT16867.1 hypothetical protein CA12_29750 [Alienimonas californiensis]